MVSTEGFVTAEGGVRLFFQKAGSGRDTLIIINGFSLFDDFRVG